MPPRFVSAGYGYDERQPAANNGKLFGRRRTIHQLFGGGKVADIVLWRNKHVSGAILAGVTLTWFLFEVVEYHFLTLLCQFFIAAMLLIFIWSNGAALLDRLGKESNGVRLIKISSLLFLVDGFSGSGVQMFHCLGPKLIRLGRIFFAMV